MEHWQGLYRSLNRALLVLRWATAVALLLLTLVEPQVGRVGIPNWGLLLMFGAYSLVADVLTARLWPGMQSAGRCVLDLVLAGLLYFLDGGPGAPLFGLIFLAVVCAGVIMSPRAGIVYTMVAAAIVVAIDPTLPVWQGTAEDIREMGTRVVLLLVAGVGASALAHRLALEQAASHSAGEEARRLHERDTKRGLLLATISHGLRTPFTAVRAGIGLVESSAGDRLHPDERQLLSEVQSNADRLGIRIRDLLSFNQLEAGALVLERKSLDLRTIVADALSVVHPLIVEKGQVIEADLPEPLPVLADENRLIQVVVNLIDNAHQHTPTGIRIVVCGRAEENRVQLAVSDNGPGIPKEEQEAIFEQFRTSDRQSGGWGLGLAVAKAITELHGGKIWVESETGHGSTFQVTLPRSTGDMEDGPE